MVRRDKEYKKIENITLGCYAVGLGLACATKFLPFILLTVMAYPISFCLVDENKWSGRDTTPRKRKEIKKWDYSVKFLEKKIHR